MQFPEPIGYLIYAQLNNIHCDLEWMIAATKNWVIPYPGMMTKTGKYLFVLVTE